MRLRDVGHRRERPSRLPVAVVVLQIGSVAFPDFAAAAAAEQRAVVLSQ